MTGDADARFEDADFSDRPLKLRAETVDDLAVISSLLQDAVGRAGDIVWMPRKRRLVVLVNRFRWEDADAARSARRPFERVRAALTIEGVLAVKARGISPADREAVFSLLSLEFEADDECAGRVIAHLADGAEVAIHVECLEASLADLTRPWEAQSQKAPEHD